MLVTTSAIAAMYVVYLVAAALSKNLTVETFIGASTGLVMFLRRRLKQYRVFQTSLESILAMNEHSVFLRSFAKDQEVAWHSFAPRWLYWGTGSGNKTPEDLFAKHFEQLVGPLVALGDPTDRIPRLGARRIYLRSTHWQSSIEALVSRARMVVIFASASTGMNWELSYIREHCRPAAILVLTPPKVVFWRVALGRRAKAREEWNAIITAFEEAGLRMPSEYPGDGAVIGFRDFRDPYLLTTKSGARAMVRAIGSTANRVVLARPID